jgi:hypothetical protein
MPADAASRFYFRFWGIAEMAGPRSWAVLVEKEPMATLAVRYGNGFVPVSTPIKVFV